MGNAALRFSSSLDEFLAWEERQPEHWEYVEGRLYMMTWGTLRHDWLTRPLAQALDAALEGRERFVYGPNVKVRTLGGGSTYPDVLVRCGPDDELETTADDPVAVFEMLSKGTMYHDLKRNRRQYERISTLRLIGFVWPEAIAISFVERDEGGVWRESEAEGIDGVLVIRALGIEIRLADVCARTALAAEARSAEG
jgi:Uma2 family endonuclease